MSPQPLFRHYQCTSQLIWIIHKTLTALISTAMVLFWSLSMPLAFRNLTNIEGPDVVITDAVFVSYHIRIMPTVIMMSLQWSRTILAPPLKQKGSLSLRNKVRLVFCKTKIRRLRGFYGSLGLSSEEEELVLREARLVSFRHSAPFYYSPFHLTPALFHLLPFSSFSISLCSAWFTFPFWSIISPWR